MRSRLVRCLPMVALAIVLGAAPAFANVVLKAGGPWVHSGVSVRANLVSDGGSHIRAECSAFYGSVSRRITACQVRNGSGVTVAVGPAKGPSTGNLSTVSSWFTSGCTTTSYRAVIGYDIGSTHYTNYTTYWKCR
jgi:hypothetical protein